ncbi:MAG TPA: glycosyltransferase family 4 protein [Chloroflexota bacterium]|nr:glycosyltransferase family 4 protein [Chloroflexota bacterium]
MVPIRVLMVSGEFPPQHGGLGDYTNLLCQHLAAMNIEVGVVTSKAAGELARGKGFPVAPAVSRWDFFCWPELGKRIRTMNANIIHVQYQTAAYGLHPAINLLPLALRMAKNPAKVVFTFHDLDAPRQPWLRGPGRRMAMRVGERKCDAFVATNGADFQQLLQSRPGPPWARYHLIPIGANVLNRPPRRYTRDAQRKKLGAGARTLLLSHFGLLNHSKGMQDLLVALKLLVEQGLDAKLVIVGGTTGSSDTTNVGFAAQIRGQVQQLGLAGRVQETGFLDPEQVTAHLLASDICVLPYRDGASFRRGSLMAALEHGLCLLTTRPAESELVDGQNCRLAEPANPVNLARIIDELAEDEVTRRRLGFEAAKLGKRFGWPAIAEKHQALYLEVLEESVG